MNQYKKYLNNALFYNSLKKAKEKRSAKCSCCPLSFYNQKSFFGIAEYNFDCSLYYTKFANLFHLIPFKIASRTKNCCLTMQKELLKIIEQRYLINE